MTTHYEKIQALGNKMASNLTAMGVSASFNDGGLTLADKILDINHFEDGLLLSSSKLIAQSSNTIYFTALLLENKTFKSGESVVFKSDNLIPFTYTSFYNINKELGNSFTIKCSGGEDHQLNLYDDGGRYWLNYLCNSGFGILMDGSEIISGFSGGDSTLSFEDGVFSTNGQTVDYSAYFDNVILRDAIPDQSESSIVVYCDVLGIEDTNSYGIATVPLVCSGSGKHTITAKSGSVVSQPYSVWDTKFYDLATDNTKESSWYIDTTNTSVSYDGDGRTVTKTDNSQSWRYIFYDSNAITSTKVGSRYAIPIPNIIEFDITAITGSIIFEIRDDNNNSMTNQGAIATGHYKIVLDGTDCKMYKDDATTPYATATMNGANIRFGFVFNAYNESITYKNFKVYSY